MKATRKILFERAAGGAFDGARPRPLKVVDCTDAAVSPPARFLKKTTVKPAAVRALGPFSPDFRAEGFYTCSPQGFGLSGPAAMEQASPM